jgi:hypothetical protein
MPPGGGAPAMMTKLLCLGDFVIISSDPVFECSRDDAPSSSANGRIRLLLDQNSSWQSSVPIRCSFHVGQVACESVIRRAFH